MELIETPFMKEATYLILARIEVSMVVYMGLLYSSMQEHWHWLLSDLTGRGLNKEKQWFPYMQEVMLAIM